MSDNYVEEVRLPSARYEAHFDYDGLNIDQVLRVVKGVRKPVSQQEDQLVREIIRLRQKSVHGRVGRKAMSDFRGFVYIVAALVVAALVCGLRRLWKGDRDE